MNDHLGGEKSWSEDDLFDLDSALDWGGTAEDVADFLGREVAEVERKAAERNLPDLSTPGIAPAIPVNPVEGIRLDFEKPAPSAWRDPGADDSVGSSGRKTGQ